MLKVYVGPPRSGKSYLAVRDLLKYCDYDPISRIFELKPRHLVVTNIDGLKINTQSLESLIVAAAKKETVPVKRLPSESDKEYERRKGITNLFHAPTWEKVCKRYDKIIFVIDEVQTFFPSYDRTIPNSVWFWFEYHGHFGADIIVMSQSAESIHRRVIAIVETIVEAQPQTMRLKSNIFKYTQKSPRTYEVLGSEFVKADPKVFNAYKSATHKEGIKKQKTYLTYYISATAALFAVFCIALWGFNEAYSRHERTDEQLAKQQQQPEAPNQKGINKKVTYKNHSKQYDPEQEKVITRSIVAKWSISGIPQSDYELIPSLCEIRSSTVKCPPYSIPRKILANLKLTEYCLTRSKVSTCYVYFDYAQPENEYYEENPANVRS